MPKICTKGKFLRVQKFSTVMVRRGRLVVGAPTKRRDARGLSCRISSPWIFYTHSLNRPMPNWISFSSFESYFFVDLQDLFSWKEFHWILFKDWNVDFDFKRLVKSHFSFIGIARLMNSLITPHFIRYLDIFIRKISSVYVYLCLLLFTFMIRFLVFSWKYIQFAFTIWLVFGSVFEHSKVIVLLGFPITKSSVTWNLKLWSVVVSKL